MNTSPFIKKAILPIILASSLAVLSATIQANGNTNPPEVYLDAAGLTVSAPASVATLYRLELRVALPDGKVEKIVTDGEAINFSAFNLPDGSYNYETWAMATNENGKYETGLSRGKFKVVSGMVYMKPAARSANPEGEEQGMLYPQNSQPLWQKILTTSLDFVIPSVHAADVLVDDSTPEIEFEDTTAEGSDSDGREWSLMGQDASFIIYDDTNDTGSSNVDNEANYTPVFKIEALGTYPGHAKIDTAPTFESIVIEDTGNISFADGNMYLSKVGGKLGLGTITPDSGIHSKVSGKTQVVKLENTAHSTWTMGQSDAALATPATDGDFQLNITDNGNGGPTGTQLSIKDENGNVGLGTNNPLFDLHIKRDDANIFVQDTNGASASGVLLELSKNGIPAFRLTNTASSTSWDFSQRNDKRLVMSLGGSGAFEFTIDKDGNTVTRGNSTALAHISTSSRESKTDFEPINAKEVMSKIKAMEVSEWRYKNTASKGRHIGPMAEDFYSLFELGPDDKHVAATDMASIALIAAKELQKTSDVVRSETAVLKTETLALKAENASLKDQGMQLAAKNDELQNRLASLEKLVTNLASGQGVLPEKGDKIVLK